MKMRDFATNKDSAKAGLLPGTLVHIGEKKADKVSISTISYNSESFEYLDCVSISECLNIKDDGKFYWINVNGLHNTEIIKKIGEEFHLHPLLLEDILNTNHRPKIEEYDNYLFFTLKLLQTNKKRTKIQSEQVSFVLGKNWLISFQEKKDNTFDIIHTRLSENKGIIRQKGTDYLFYSLIDSIVDNYFFVSEFFNMEIEKLEELVIHDPSETILQEIQYLKRLVMNFRKAIIPLREAVASIQKYNAKLINKATIRYLSDVYEHLTHLNDMLETQRENLVSVMDLYLSGISNKMNQIMKVLTIISTIFIPLTFLTAVYGMNFEDMPELHWKYGYLAIWIVMLTVVMIMIAYFKRKRWL